MRGLNFFFVCSIAEKTVDNYQVRLKKTENLRNRWFTYGVTMRKTRLNCYKVSDLGRKCEIFRVTGGRKCGRVILLRNMRQLEAEKLKFDVAVRA